MKKNKKNLRYMSVGVGVAVTFTYLSLGVGAVSMRNH